MTKEEENKALEAAWDKITQWVKENCKFPRTMEFKFPHHVYHWSKVEVYPSGDCAVLRGSWGNPGEYRPTMIHGHEEFGFGLSDNEPNWYGEEKDFARFRNSPRGLPSYKNRISSHWLLRELYDNWGYIKAQIVSAIDNDKRLQNFEV